MSKMETQIIQTEYGVFVPKPYNPANEKLTSAAPSIVERAIVALKQLLRNIEHKPDTTTMTRNAKPAR